MPKKQATPPDTESAPETPLMSVTREVLEEAPGKAVKILRAIGTNIPIRAALESKGYTEEDHQEGWALVHAASGYSPGASGPTLDVAVRDAIVTLDRWDEGGFSIVEATLTRRFPEVAKVVLAGIGPQTGPAAVASVKTLLDRIDGLAKSTDKNDKAAFALLAKRGIDEAERKRLRDLIATAESVTAVPPVDEKGKANAEAKRIATLEACRAWNEEWSAIARVVIKRRDYLILLGLAKRKAPKPKTP